MPTLTGLKVVALSLSQSSRTYYCFREAIRRDSRLKSSARSKVLNFRLYKLTKKTKDLKVRTFLLQCFQTTEARENCNDTVVSDYYVANF